MTVVPCLGSEGLKLDVNYCQCLKQNLEAVRSPIFRHRNGELKTLTHLTWNAHTFWAHEKGHARPRLLFSVLDLWEKPDGHIFDSSEEAGHMWTLSIPLPPPRSWKALWISQLTSAVMSADTASVTMVQACKPSASRKAEESLLW